MGQEISGEFLTKPRLCLTWVITYGKSMPQT